MTAATSSVATQEAELLTSTAINAKHLPSMTGSVSHTGDIVSDEVNSAVELADLDDDDVWTPKGPQTRPTGTPQKPVKPTRPLA
ncbi:hypothetical protein DICSQDRAFT_164566 [Dichomitus squalens LYAD-421 SS1]|uniref:Uncharacterized protein n=1 Tax=Dichomitus squalens TaxID=114155 RepID=A0A4Q9N401_9APHY|nr:uncharacterized protein DICSQDRAFT_164566 [Dichomitus squalens LYAD-421 SS1]EJF66724.1 hypothetical protein DICSQDRAFT_164566 [Dichomitus squalens LYAD-421 SS1]TBU35279.1 hypothetical protein BD311DRAFT_210483 [Dichomitus squalens]